MMLTRDERDAMEELRYRLTKPVPPMDEEDRRVALAVVERMLAEKQERAA